MTENAVMLESNVGKLDTEKDYTKMNRRLYSQSSFITRNDAKLDTVKNNTKGRDLAGRIYKLLTKEQMSDLHAKDPKGGRLRYPPAVSKHNPYFLEERKVSVCREFLGGDAKDQIAEKHKISISTVERYLKENNINTRKEKITTRKEQLREYLGKYTKKRIAEMLGISRTRLYQIMEEEGI